MVSPFLYSLFRNLMFQVTQNTINKKVGTFLGYVSFKNLNRLCLFEQDFATKIGLCRMIVKILIVWPFIKAILVLIFQTFLP